MQLCNAPITATSCCLKIHGAQLSKLKGGIHHHVYAAKDQWHSSRQQMQVAQTQGTAALHHKRPTLPSHMLASCLSKHNCSRLLPAVA